MARCVTKTQCCDCSQRGNIEFTLYAFNWHFFVENNYFHIDIEICFAKKKSYLIIIILFDYIDHDFIYKSNKWWNIGPQIMNVI